MEKRTILAPLPPENFPDNPNIPEGVQTVTWQDAFGFGVAFKPGIVYANRGETPLHLHYLTPSAHHARQPG